MRKLTVILLILIFLIISFFTLKKDNTFEVLKVLSASDFYIDFNKNKVAEENELVQLFELDLEPEHLGKIEKTELNYLGKVFAKQKLLGKKVKVVHVVNKDLKIILPDNSDYAKTLEERGYIFNKINNEKIVKNLEYAKTLELVSYNTVSQKYHKLDCKYASDSRNEEIMKKKDLPHFAKPCKLCHLNENKDKINLFEKYPRDVEEPYSPIYKDKWIEFYITDFIKYYYPSSKCLTTACKSLLQEIKAAKSSIDFAVYGFDSQPAITDALVEAEKRGVKIRWVFDTDKKGDTIYKETLLLKNILKNARADTNFLLSELDSKPLKDAIMHNKFFIFDNQKVWSGSANITRTDLSGFNANAVVLINSSTIAQLYKSEFEQMFSGRFHQLKNNKQSLANNTILGASKVSVFFSPQDKIIANQIIPLVNKSEKYIYVPVFVITHKEFKEALINAKNRGVDVRIIVDATSAGAKYSSVKQLRDNGIKVKTENRAGKMHMKSLIIDDRYVVLGSMNFTKSGESYNDENVVILENPSLAMAYKKNFLYFYSAIPDKWLYKNPGAESRNSVNSCFDGIDNDFDGKIDSADEGCRKNTNKFPG